MYHAMPGVNRDDEDLTVLSRARDSMHNLITINFLLDFKVRTPRNMVSLRSELKEVCRRYETGTVNPNRTG